MAAEDLPVQRGVVIPGAELSWQASLAGGPGGQHVNKTASRVTLRWAVARSAVLSDSQRARLMAGLASRLTRDGELLVHVQDHRSQLQNLATARERLADVVRAALFVPRARRATRPSKGSQRRRVASKQRRGSVKRQRGRPGADD